MPVSILADSAASLPPALARSRHITIVPMLLDLAGRTFHDGEVSLEEVIAVAPQGLSTSAPTPGQFLEAIQSVDTGDGVVIVTVATTMSSAFDSARLAARQLDVAVEVIDTRTAAGGEGLVALAAADAADRGGDVTSVAGAARAAAARIRLVASLDSLEHLARSGRVPEAAAWAGRWLHLNPVFEFVDGHPHALLPAHSRAAALERVLGRWRETRVEAARLHVAALCALDADPAEQLLARVRAECPREIATAFVASFSAVMVAHTGPGLVGLSWWWEPSQSPVG